MYGENWENIWLIVWEIFGKQFLRKAGNDWENWEIIWVMPCEKLGKYGEMFGENWENMGKCLGII
jgi:hypothetical protein